MLLSIAMIVKNEEKHLEKCLTALLPLKEKLKAEIVIVDTGSTDNTVNIAQKFTNKVYFHEWNGNFAEMRNISIQKCKGEWIFVVDADEVLEDSNNLVKFFKDRLYKKFKSAAIGIKTRNEINKEEDFNKYVVCNLIRLFERRDNVYVGRVHEQPMVEAPCYKLNSYLLHYGYVTTDATLMLYKFERNTKLLNEDLKEKPNHIYTLYQLSNSYSMYGDNKQALNYIRKAYNNIKSKTEINTNAYVIHQYARMCYANGLHEEVIEACEKAITEKQDFLDFYFYLARSLMMINKNKEALESFERYLYLQSQYEHTSNSLDISMATYTLCMRDEVLYYVGVLYSKEGKYLTAIENLKQIQEKGFIERTLEIYVYCLIRNNDIYSIYELHTKENNNDFRNIIVNSIHKFASFLSKENEDKLLSLFSEEDTTYGLVCKLKISINDNRLDINEIKQLMGKFDFNNYVEYKCHLLYFIIKDEMENIYSYFNLNNYTLQLYLRDIINNYPESALKMFKFIQKKVFEPDIKKIHINIVVEFILMTSNKFSDNDYIFLFKKYIFDTIEYMKYMYKSELLNIHNYYLFNNSEELFCLYINTAIKQFKNNQVEYIKALRKALKLCKHHKKGVEFLINEFIELPNNDEYNNLAKDLKGKIQQLINNENFINAKMLINDYKKINSRDEDVINMDAVIDFYEGSISETNIKLLDSILLNDNNFETLFNIACVLENDKNYLESLSFYRRALVQCDEFHVKEIIENKINQLERIN